MIEIIMIEITINNKYKIHFGYFPLWHISNGNIGYIAIDIYINI